MISPTKKKENAIKHKQQYKERGRLEVRSSPVKLLCSIQLAKS